MYRADVSSPNGMLYVGKSSDIDKRIGEHASGTVACTSSWGIPREVPTLTPRIDVDNESWERNETLEQMQRNGIDKVRGWMYTTQELTDEAEEGIVSQLCEKYDCCRLCGSGGHFVSACPQGGHRSSRSDRHSEASSSEEDSSAESEAGSSD